MGIGGKLVLCIPTILVTAVSNFLPWGLITAVLTLVLYGAVLFFPSKSLVRTNANIALKGLTHGDLSIAKSHVEIALREAANSHSLALPDLELLRQACEKTVSALKTAGQVDSAYELSRFSVMALISYAHGEES